jgi:vesicle-fusing ATPase
MGPAMVLEISLDPKIQNDAFTTATQSKGDMVLQKLAWNPRNMFQFANEEVANSTTPIVMTSSASTLQGKERNDAFATDFRSRVGGLSPQIDAIVRRVLDGRVIRPAETDGAGNLLSYGDAKEMNGDQNMMHLDHSSKQLSVAALEAQELEVLGLTPVKGLLLYGPPGCGKTALAREIARALKARAPKIVSAPELLDRWVGGSERLVRELFHDAEAELAACDGDATRSALHVIVIDEIDAVFRKRSSAEDSGEATRSSTVNQILAKLDGVQAIPNVLLIGMTNRRELLDEALLRPGRLEVQIEIPLPSREGRREILQIHTDALRKKGRLSHPLCCAIDGITSEYTQEAVLEVSDSEDNILHRSRGRKRRAIKRATSNLLNSVSHRLNVYDLADDRVTGGFSGAELAGLVRCAGSIALSRARKEGGGVESLLITLDDIKSALDEVKV